MTVTSAATLRNVPLDGASSIIESGSHLWIANDSGHALVVELNVATGSLVRAFSARLGHKWTIGPDAMAVSGSDLWLANSSNNEVLEFSVLDGKLLRIIRAEIYHFSFPVAIAVSGSDVWVANSNNDSVTELSAVNGRLIRVVGAQKGKFAGPLAIAVAKNRVFVTNGRDNSMTELDASNGTFIHLFGKGGRLGHPDSLAILGSDIWVEGRYILSEINISSGVLVKSFDFKSAAFNVLEGIAVGNSNIWIDDFKSATKINPLSGSTELNVNPPTHYGANALKGIALTREAVWVTNLNSVIEMNARNGSVLRVVR
jgi:DNA-binding beta-propeller fold protein YncE